MAMQKREDLDPEYMVHAVPLTKWATLVYELEDKEVVKGKRKEAQMRDACKSYYDWVMEAADQ